MAWTVILGESVIDDLRWFGRKVGRRLLQEAEERLGSDPLIKSRNNKALRPNPFAQRELRISGKYRILYYVDVDTQLVTIVAAGEKRGNVLLVRGEEFSEYEDYPAE
jgi:mRNA-degrading endonuclease RelE of RelBE toxin-antitoxin system